ncbi:MAG TPA: serine/threonine-protein kinase [Bryobacteraceae bacterium]|nr:serine/threonine-protein kinase [Bryobacteraceae bacterium]
MSFLVGQTVGDYEIVDILGRGGMGRVFRVRNLISHRIDAMKVVLPDLESDPALADRFLREIQVHASLNHPNIARLNTALRLEGRLVMILEYVQGVSLDERLRRGPVGLREAVDIIIQVLSALSYAHACGIIHRDLKPANIIVTPTGQVKLTDFGIAHAAGAPKLTRTGLALGSLYYVSPEQVRTEPVDARSDLYSLGVTFYELVTGKRPIDGASEYSIMNAHLTHIPVAPASLNTEIPAEISAIILKALAKDAKDRFQSAHEFQSELLFFGATPVSGLAAHDAQVPHAAPAIDPAQLAKVEAKLVPLVGPVATRLVARAARRHSSLADLCRSIAENIPENRERAAFLRSCEANIQPVRTNTASAMGAPAVPSNSGAANPQLLDPTVLAAVRQKLATYIGPIAGMVVTRAAKRARNQRELYETVAAEIGSAKDREAFLASLAR